MRSLAVFLCCCVLLCGGMPSHAQTSDVAGKRGIEAVPGFIMAGLKAYRDSGPDEAIRTWVKGRPIEGSKDVLAQANSLRQVQEFYGPYQAFEIINIRDLGPRTRVLYLILDLEKGPLFAKFVVYHATQGWVLANFSFNTHDEAVFPLF